MKVTSVRYWNTRQGLGYEAKTDIKGVSIWNDGDGGATYVHINGQGDDTTHAVVHNLRDRYNEHDLENLIDEFEL